MTGETPAPLVGYIVYRARRRVIVRPFRSGTTATWPFIVAHREFTATARLHYVTGVCPSLREARAPFRAWGWTKRMVGSTEFWLPKGLRLYLPKRRRR